MAGDRDRGSRAERVIVSILCVRHRTGSSESGTGTTTTIGRKGIFWYEIKLQTVNFFGNLSWMCHAHLLPPRVVSSSASSSSWQFIRGPTTLFVRSSFLVAATTVN